MPPGLGIRSSIQHACPAAATPGTGRATVHSAEGTAERPLRRQVERNDDIMDARLRESNNWRRLWKIGIFFPDHLHDRRGFAPLLARRTWRERDLDLARRGGHPGRGCHWSLRWIELRRVGAGAGLEIGREMHVFR